MKKLILSLAALVLPLSAQSAPAETEGDDTVIHTYILLDRTGSMSGIWDEALGSVNAYAKSLADDSDGLEVDGKITVAVFDSQDGIDFDILRRGVNADDWSDITNDEASPRGMTPLFDAIGRTVIVAEADEPEKAIIVIMTDGKENASREFDKKSANAALDRARARGWEVVFLGAEYANFSDAEAVGVTTSKSMAIGSGNIQQSMDRLGKKSRGYASGEEAEIEFDEEDRAVAGEDDVKDRKGNR